MLETDEDMAKETLVETQETAGFHEAPQRLAVGGHFNRMLLWSVLDCTAKQKQPSGALAEQIQKQFTSFDGFKESFRKAVMSRVLPGWVWLGCGKKSGDLVITQTNNEDNPLMHGVAEPQCTPVFGIDLWEHAYFAQYEGDRAAYCEWFLQALDWERISAHYE